jgi:hypothetical protein
VSPHREQRGAVLLEAALVLPVLLLVLLGALQLILLAQTRLALRYAAFCAARAGVVHGGDGAVMRDAALLALLPVYVADASPEGLLARAARVAALARAGSALDRGVARLEHLGTELLHVELGGLAPDLALVRVLALSPSPADLEAGAAWVRTEREAARRLDPGGELAFPGAAELDADDPPLLAAHPHAGVLAVEVRALVPLRVPLAGALLHAAWLAAAGLGSARTGGPGESAAELLALRLLAARRGLHLVPLHATWVMPMQSSVFRDALPREAGGE